MELNTRRRKTVLWAQACVNALALSFTIVISPGNAGAKTAMTANASTYCMTHERPLVTVNGFQSTSNPLVLVHAADPRSVACDKHAPNRIPDDQHLTRSKIHIIPHAVTYCPQCAADYWECMGNYEHLSKKDIGEITALVLMRGDFRKPVIRIIPLSKTRSLVVGGRERKAGDFFSDIGLSKRGGRWVVQYAGVSHRILALGKALKGE
jgi:hypothetical protein